VIDLTDKASLYNIFHIKKPNGKYRTIYAPCDQLKAEQRAIASRLDIIQLSEHAYGFRAGVCIADATRQHVGKDWVITMDIYNFFPSITSDMMPFLTDYEKEVVTLRGRLVQGSPCSPVISNIIMLGVDEEFGRHFNELGIEYSRYADDMTISGAGKPSWQYVNYIGEHLLKIGLRLNREKIKFMFKNEQQKVLGLRLNDKISVDRTTRKRLRAKVVQKNLTISDRGMLSFIKSVNPDQYYNILGL
jgi:hypothetical protein